MLVRRCAWHRRFHGYPLYFGVSTWRGRSIMFTDGVCASCAQRVRTEWKLVERGTPAPLPLPWLGFRRVAAGVLSLALLAGTMLSPVPLGDLPSRVQAPVAPSVAVDAQRQAPPPTVRPKRPRPKQSIKRPPRPRFEELEMALALADVRTGPADPEAAPPTEIAAVVEEPVASQIDTLEAEVSRAILQRASARLLLAKADLPFDHAGSTVQTP